MRRTLAIAISALLLAWGAYAFVSEVTQVAPWTGVEWVDSSHGVVADAVIPRTAAWRGGLRPGDRLRSIDAQPTLSALAAEDAPWRLPSGGTLSYLIERDGDLAEFTVRPNWVGGGTSVYYYFSIVGLTFLAVGMVVWLRAARARGALPFALLCQAMFLLLVLSPTGQATISNWAVYWGDLAARLIGPALFVHTTWTLADDERGSARRRLRRILFYLPPVLLFLQSLYLIPFKMVYRFSDPEAAIRFKNRLDDFYIGIYLIVGIV